MPSVEGNKQIIITSDRFFKELQGVENRLRSRLGQGITIRVRPPELETRIAILDQRLSGAASSLNRMYQHSSQER